MRQEKTLSKMRSRTEDLIAQFDECLDTFEAADLFTGRSLYCHLRTIELRAAYPNAEAALADDAFLATLYETLVAWRMAERGARLVLA